jgi:prevent-host-death family protein
MSQAVNVTELKACLSAYLKRVKSGEDVVITERGKAIARIVPLDEPGPTPARYEEMVKAGIIRPGRRDLPDDILDHPLPVDPGGSVLEALLEERETGR